MQKITFGYRLFGLILFAFLFSAESKSQQPITKILVNTPTVRVLVKQQLSFGAFTQGPAGGSVTLMADGSRAASGSVVPLNFGSVYMPLVLEIEGPKGAIVTMLADEKNVLTGSNGGVMSLRLKSSNPVMPFIITEDAPAKSIITIGAELFVGSSTESPPGNYNGSLNISFIVE